MNPQKMEVNLTEVKLAQRLLDAAEEQINEVTKSQVQILGWTQYLKLLSPASKHFKNVRTKTADYNNFVYLQGGVNRIDRVSRVAFPLAFFFFNGIYWFVYLSHQAHEVAHRLNP